MDPARNAFGFWVAAAASAGSTFSFTVFGWCVTGSVKVTVMHG